MQTKDSQTNKLYSIKDFIPIYGLANLMQRSAKHKLPLTRENMLYGSLIVLFHVASAVVGANNLEKLLS